MDVHDEGPGVPPDAPERCRRVFHDIVLPVLPEAVGAEPVLPDRVFVHRSQPRSFVRADMHPETGRLTAVDEPRILAGSDAYMAYMLCHELAHFHELSVRLREDLWLGSVTATLVWSEYFAERVEAQAGHRADDHLEENAAIVASMTLGEPHESDAGADEAYAEVPYALTWWFAHAHADGWRPEGAYGRPAGALNRAFRRLPGWRRADVQAVRGAARAMVGLRSATRRR